MQRGILIVLLALLTFPVLSQKHWGSSKNSAYFISGLKASKGYTVNLYSVAKKAWIRQVNLPNIKASKVLGMEVSGQGKSFVLYTKDSVIVYDVLAKEIGFRQVHRGKDPLIAQEVEFCTQSTDFLLLGRRRLDLYDIKDKRKWRQQKRVYTYTSQTKPSNVSFAQEDKYFFVSDGFGKILVFDQDVYKPVIKLKGHTYKVNKKANRLVTLESRGGNYKLYTFSLKTLKRKGLLSINRFVKGIIKGNRALGGAKGKFSFLDVSLSKDGHYTVLFLKIKQDEKALVVYDNFKKELVGFKAFKETVYEYKLQHFTNTTVGLRRSAFVYMPFSLTRLELGTEVSSEIIPSSKKDRLKEKAQLKERIGSSYLNYFVIPSKNKKNKGFHFQATLKPSNSYHFFKGLTVFGFSPNERYLLVKKGDVFGFYDVSEGNAEKGLHLFKDERPPEKEEQIDFTNLKGDTTKIRRILNVTKLSKAKKGAKMELYYHGMEMTDSSVKIHVQLIDQFGNYYGGASKDKNRWLWCNMLLRDAKGDFSQVKDFKVTEEIETTEMPNNIGLVGDFSGSMGEVLTDVLTKGMQTVIDEKVKKDALTIIKYDHRVKINAKMQKSKQALTKRLKKYTFRRSLGGATGLLDAVNEGVTVMRKKKGYGQTVIVALTDGWENASVTTMSQLIYNAKVNGIKVYTVALGPFANFEMLENIANHTGGNFYKINNPNYLDWIYRDILRKSKNYYTVEVKLDKIDTYQLLMKICPPKCKGCSDTLLLNFKNYNPDLSKFDPSDPNFFSSRLVPDSAMTKPKGKPKVFKDIVWKKAPRKVSKPKAKVVKDTASFETIEKEFSKIELPQFNFHFDTDSIVQDQDSLINVLVQFLKKHPGVQLEIVGHTDNKGSDVYNQKLSQRRAMKIRGLLIQGGIAAKRLKGKGKGEKEPISDNETEEGRAKNRRIEYIISELD